ncbi:MAG: hypothetical protein JNK12_23695 [Acidimicrobiales bacterium]|nr:hypothetical protein [Acidimicrobiales bacterium]
MLRPAHRRRLLRLVVALALVAGIAGSTSSTATAAPRQEAADAEAFTTLALLNGWSNYGSGSNAAKVSVSNGVVRFKGAIETAGTDPVAFVLPPGMRPSKRVFIPVTLCSATNGRLLIRPNGTVEVDSEGPFSDAQCFTSLEGASFTLAPAGQTDLTLLNGWVGGPSSTRPARVANIGGVIHFSGAISTAGASNRPFVLPAGMRPAATVFVPVDLCGASDGRLRITPSGTVTVQTDDGFADAQCFTSLDGAHFVLNPPSAGLLTLTNGWTGQPYHTRKPRATLVGGAVQLSGAIANGTSAELFILPVGLRPTKLVYIQVDLCGAANGRLIIEPDGTTEVEAEIEFSDAQCFLSLEGASFAR